MNAPASQDLPPILAPPPTGQIAVNRRRWWIHLLLIGAYPLLVGLVGWGRLDIHGPALSHGAKGLILVCTVELLVFALVFGLGWLASRASRDDLLWRWSGGFWTVPLGIGYSVAIRLALAILVIFLGVVAILARLATPETLQDFVSTNRPGVEAIVDIGALRRDPLYFWLTLTLVSFVVGGFREELWRAAFLAGLRSLWPRTFGSRGGQLAAVGVGAVIFGLGHLPQGALAVGFTGLIGFGLGLIMVLHRSIWPAVIAHGTFNATSFALLPWAMQHLQGFP